VNVRDGDDKNSPSRFRLSLTNGAKPTKKPTTSTVGIEAATCQQIN
jgi:hypothetical protein